MSTTADSVASTNYETAFDLNVHVTRTNLKDDTQRASYHVLEQHGLGTNVIDVFTEETGAAYHILEQHDLEINNEDMYMQEPEISDDDLEEPVYHETVVSTLEEWLTVLGLSCYINTFIDNGWENLMVLAEMTEADLDRMKINNRSHRSLILSCIEDFKLC